MSRRGSRRGRVIPVVVFTFVAGVCTGWILRAPVTRAVLMRSSDLMLPTGTTGDGASTRAGVDRPDTTAATSPPDSGRPPSTTDSEAAPVSPVISSGDPLDALRIKDLRLPIDDANVNALKGQFGDRRDNGARGHEAVDILAPRNTPVHAVDDGSVAKLFLSKQGGITVYQFDPGGRFCYYYAHLERYAEGLHEGQQLARGDIIGYVGTSGNAPPNTPHLHFAIFSLTPERHWWQGTPLDPWPVFSH